jgi:integrase
MSQTNSQKALVRPKEEFNLILQNAVHLWANATTDTSSPRRPDLLRDKQLAVIEFFGFIGKRPQAVTPIDIKSWQDILESRQLSSATIYGRISRLSSFYNWALRDSALGQMIKANPVDLARPRAPKPYQTASAKSLDDDQLRTLLNVVKAKAISGDIVGKRDLALLLFFIITGMRRNEVISLRGKDIEIKRDAESGQDYLVIRTLVKGGDYIGREIRDTSVIIAIYDYLSSCQRINALKTDRPLWTRHDHAGNPGAPLTSHAFAKNLKRYARDAGLTEMHIHKTRHTYARIVAEDTGSITETQDALGHKNLATTRVYVQRIAIKRDKHSKRISERLQPKS